MDTFSQSSGRPSETKPNDGAASYRGKGHAASRPDLGQGLERVREAAKQRKKERFTALLHHVTIDLLKDEYSWLKREADPAWMVGHGRATSRTWKST